MLPALQELGERLLTLAQRLQNPAVLPEAHFALGNVALWRGDFVDALSHCQQGIGSYDPQQHRGHVFRYGQDPCVQCTSYMARALWFLGYPDQALAQMSKAQALAEELAHPLNMAFSLFHATALYLQSHDTAMVLQEAETLIKFATKAGDLRAGLRPVWFNRAGRW